MPASKCAVNKGSQQIRDCSNVIKGVFTAFDRIVFRGRIMPLNNDAGTSAYACKAGVLFKD